MVYAEAAMECVKWISGKEMEEDAELSKHGATIAAALTSIIHSANFIEQVAKDSDTFGKVSVLVCVRGWRPHCLGLGVSVRNFTLWGPPSIDTQEIPRSTRLLRNETQVQSNGMNDCRESSAEMQDRRLTSVLNAIPSCPAQTSIHGPSNIHLDQTYSVPIQVSRQCLSLLLDGSGITAHSMATRDSGYVDVSSRELELLVHELHKKETERLRRAHTLRDPQAVAMDLDADGTNEDSNEEVIKDGKGLKYSSLVPDHLQDKTVALPILQVNRVRPTTADYVTKQVTMSLRKPDRNTKDRNFALLTIHLHHFRYNGSAGRILSKFSSAGLMHDTACKVWGRFSKSKDGKTRTHQESAVATTSGTFCGGPESCALSPSSVCTFYYHREGVKVEAGKGMVYPRCALYKGGLIAPHCVLARFAEVNPLALREPSSSEASSMSSIEDMMNSTVLWKIKDVSRVSLIGKYRDSIGTAVLVNKNPLKEIEIPGNGRRRSKSARSSRPSMDLSRAVVVCDIQLHTALYISSSPYPYSEWYSISTLKSLVRLHFSNRNVPSTLKDLVCKEVREVLWDSAKIEEELNHH